jgi:hypothetical protein
MGNIQPWKDIFCGPYHTVSTCFGVNSSLITDWRVVKLIGKLRFVRYDKMLLPMLLMMSLMLSLLLSFRTK